MARIRRSLFAFPAPSDRMSHPILLHFEGGNALSAFRSRSLLQALQRVNERIAEVSARHVHWVRCAAPLPPDDVDKLAALLRYGDQAGPAGAAGDGLIVVMPRLGTVSPWASKATDIAHNCGLCVQRIERVTEYRLGLKRGLLGAGKPLTGDELAACAALLHDPHDRERGLRARGRAICSTSKRRRRSNTSTCWGRARPRKRPTSASAWRSVTTRSAIWSRPSPGSAATPATSS